ncbi:MAG: chemotaxis protein CheW [Deltaproteobacteria bacterium]|nr:chemotaxis protein CheW [Deltaproteobacteria bacterium]
MGKRKKSSQPAISADSSPSASSSPAPPPCFIDPAMQEIMKDFVVEARENLDQIDSSLVALENDPENNELLNKVFRVMHTIKGGAGFLGLEKVQKLSHHSEDLLNKIRNKEMRFTHDIADVILNSADILKKLVLEVEDGGKELSDITAAIERMSSISKQTPAPTTLPSDVPPSVAVAAGFTPAVHDAAIKAAAAHAPQVKISSNTVRIDVDKLDVLMNLAGELVLARNRQSQIAKDIAAKYPQDEFTNSQISSAAHQINMLTTDIQAAVMKTRMLPVSTLFDKYTRVARDMCRTLGKEADLVITGGKTEIDKNVLEELADPMTHLIRNSLDHGIELPEERVKKGKGPLGVITLSAYHEGSYVIIRIKDDGKGIDPAIVKKKAVEKGIISASKANNMSDKEALDLIFAPGFSTAEKVSSVSGRGVGMDVVKTNIEKLKGIIEVNSAVNKGTSIRLFIPLTLAILQTLLCRAGGQRFAIPLAAVKETFNVSNSDITTIRGREVIRVRDEVLPVLRLKDIFEIKSQEGSSFSIVILQLGTKRLGLAVDETIRKEEVVIKSLSCLKGIYTPPHVSGLTILGSGIITLIIDVESLIQFANQSGRDIEKELISQKAAKEEMERVLIVDDRTSEQYAIPIRFVRNLELISDGEIEQVGNKEVVKYYGEVLPLIRLCQLAKYPAPPRNRTVYMIVVSDGTRKGGLLANNMRGLKQIKKLETKDCFTNNNISGSTIIDNKVALILNHRIIIENIYSGDYSLDTASPSLQTQNDGSLYGRQKTILLVDDSATHRSIQGKVVQEAGYNVVYAEDGAEGLKKLSGIDLVLTDLEMPKMDGYAFTAKIKEQNSELPVIMLTSRSGDEDRAKGLKAGVDDYLIKLDKELLLRAIKRFIG